MTAPAMSDLQADLQRRWLPSEVQMRQADELLAAGDPAVTKDGVFTIHLLVNKPFGVWNLDVEVVHLDGVFTDRAAALDRLNAEGERYHQETGKPLTGGWAWHPRPGEAAVFEDICTQHEQSS